MPDADQFQVDVARLALKVARQHGFALAGSHALIAYGIVDRATEDVDLFTNADGAVQAAGKLVQACLTDAGYTVNLIPETTELGDVFAGFQRDMVEFEVRRADQATRVQLCRFDRNQSPVRMEIGLVLHIDDVIGSKVAAMATRAEPRDFIDVAAAHERYDQRQLIELGRRADPALTHEEFADAMRRLDRLDDVVFETIYGCKADEISAIRLRFATWPRS
jgi:hypothetical protein